MPKEIAKQSKSKAAAKPVAKKPAPKKPAPAKKAVPVKAAAKAPAKTKAPAKAPVKTPAKAPAKAAAAKTAPAKVAPAKAQAKAAPAKAAKHAAAEVAAPAKSAAPPIAAKSVAKAIAESRGRKSREKLIAPEAKLIDQDTKRTRLKTLIALGKERGYLTYAEINDHLPDDLVDAEQIESIISTFNDMSIQVFDEAPAVDDLLLNESAPAPVDVAEVEEEAEQALSTVDSEFGRTTDPVRMY
ncbi:MAG: RNA polymerase sigma factor RpoD, partial [Sulfuritalea sp.]|nr:RNA polymerase sigma factor RpoD [Sulfuritalea sp.]